MSIIHPAKFTPEFEARIRKVCGENEDIPKKELAKRFGISVSAMMRVLNHVPRSSSRNRLLTAEQRAAIGRRAVAGETAKKLAEEFGCSTARVYQLKEAETLRTLRVATEGAPA